MIDEAAFPGEDVNEGFDLISFPTKLGPDLVFRAPPHGAARKLTCPLREIRPRYPFLPPSATQVGGEGRHPPEPIAPGDQQGIFARLHEQLRTVLGTGQDIAPDRRYAFLGEALKGPDGSDNAGIDQPFD